MPITIAHGSAAGAPARRSNRPRRSLSNRASLAVLLTAAAAVAQPASDAPLAVTGTIPLGGPGRWDYLVVEPASHQLYVTRTTHTQVIDLATHRLTADIAGGTGLHGTAVVPSAGRAFVTDGRAGKLIVIDLKSNTMLGTVAAADDADGIIYDAGSDRLLVSCGDAGQLLVLDPHVELASAKVQPVDLDGEPEFLAADGQGRVFVCLNDKNLIAAVDVKTLKVVGRWPTGTGTAPTGLAIDAKNGRLFVGCRNEKAVVMSTVDGRVLAELPIGKGNDACAFDPGTGHAFASCGDGTMAVIGETTPNSFSVLQTVQTEPGARTVALDPTTHTLYLPTAEMLPAAAGQRPSAKPDSFFIAVVGPAGEKAH